jgi:hypothetical protein
MTIKCRICDNSASEFSSAFILGKYQIKYYLCSTCGFIQTEEPYWLDEAYAVPINTSDTGIMIRNLANVRLASAVLQLCFNTDGQYADYGGGHGIFVRMMRDRGFDFYRDDKYCANLFAHGFDTADSGVDRYCLITAFELFEHFLSPCDELQNLLNKSDNILFTTEILPHPPPQLNDWWYFCLDHGQHISFFSHRSLQHLADRFALHYYNFGNRHLFTRNKTSCMAWRFKLATHPRVSRLLETFSRKKSLTSSDYKKITGVDIVNL